MTTKTSPLLLKAPCMAGVIVGRIEKRVVKRAVSWGVGALEIRVDTFEERSPATLKRGIEGLRGVEGAAGLPLILTCRDRAEGGVHAVGAAEKRLIFRELIPLIDYIDIEVRKARHFRGVITEAHEAGCGVILSYHDFHRTPPAPRLREVIVRARAAGGDIVKIAARADTRADLMRLAALLVNYKGPGRKRGAGTRGGLIVIAMGPAGRASRVFFPLLGSLVTYGSIDASTAPGQMTLKEMAAAFRAYEIGG